MSFRLLSWSLMTVIAFAVTTLFTLVVMTKAAPLTPIASMLSFGLVTMCTYQTIIARLHIKHPHLPL
jgi:hypothetical protein